MEVILEAFQSAQHSALSHKSSTKKVSTAINTGDVDVQSFFLRGCIDNILVNSDVTNATIERLTGFAGGCLALVEERGLQVCLSHLYARLCSSNKSIRERVCQILHSFVEAAYDAKVELADDLFAQLTETMLIRLKDKTPAVRCRTLRVLRRLQLTDDVNDVVTLAVMAAMKSDSAAAVRTTAVEVIALCEHTKNELCARIKDVKSEVRTATFLRLAEETDVRQFSSKMRSDILRSGLADRDEKVQAAALKVIWKWLTNTGEDVPRFLNFLNPAENAEAAQLVGTTVMDHIVRGEGQKNAKLKKATKEPFLKWQENVSALSPGELLWAVIRCDYARTFLPVLPATEICDSVLPEAMQLCVLLGEAKAMVAESSSPHRTMSHGQVKKLFYVTHQLLKVATLLVHTADICGVKAILEECVDFFCNVRLPFEGVVEHALRAFLTLHQAANANDQDPADRSATSRTAHCELLRFIEDMRNASESSDADDLVSLAASELEECGADNAEEIMAQRLAETHQLRLERALQLAQWALQREVGQFATSGRPSVVELTPAAVTAGATAGDGEEEEDSSAVESSEKMVESSVFTTLLPFIVSSLQQPVAHVRFLAVSCLGLLGLVNDEVSMNHKAILVHVAIGENFEEDFIRGQALQCLVDFAMVHRDVYLDDADLNRVLLRMQESGEPELMLLAAESTARLLYAGVMHDPNLFANLLKFFFLTENIPQDAITTAASSGEAVTEEQLAAEQAHAVFMASCARLQQLLSIFFHVFSTPKPKSEDAAATAAAANAFEGAERVIAGAIPQLVADITGEIKDETVDVTAMSKVSVPSHSQSYRYSF